MVNRVLPQDDQLNLGMPRLASNDRGPVPAFSFLAVQVMIEGETPVHTIWPCVAVQAMC